MRFIAAIAFACLFAISAEARPVLRGMQCEMTNDGREICRGGSVASNTLRNAGEGVIGSRPAGCPRRYCGCAASLYLFGRIDPYLNLASNWLRKFPRTSPAAGMAAARPGHVFVLLSHVEGNDWLVRDANSGGGLTRIHVRSIKGYTVVDPNGNRVASR